MTRHDSTDRLREKIQSQEAKQRCYDTRNSVINTIHNSLPGDTLRFGEPTQSSPLRVPAVALLGT
jgi:hypothetical protein